MFRQGQHILYRSDGANADVLLVAPPAYALTAPDGAFSWVNACREKREKKRKRLPITKS